MEDGSDAKSVVYLLGAGASHACAKFVGSAHGILMRDLNPLLDREVRLLVRKSVDCDRKLAELVNAVIDDDEDTEFEHIITFLDESPSERHRNFAGRLREAFQSVLRRQLDAIEREVGNRLTLYSALLDMHRIEGFGEELKAILTTNYDNFAETAARKGHNMAIDFGIQMEDQDCEEKEVLRLLKLHGSFSWHDEWPVREASAPPKTLWIPPGIQKSKGRYPFNVLWGLAREALDCDVLRIVGCRLSGSDWDLISLLFTTRHGNTNRRPFTVEVIDSPGHAAVLQKTYRYLDVKSLVEIETYGIGRKIVGNLLGSEAREYVGLDQAERELVESASRNWFQLWLAEMGTELAANPNLKVAANSELGRLISA